MSTPPRRASLLSGGELVGRISTDAAQRAREFVVRSASLVPRTLRLLVLREGEVEVSSPPGRRPSSAQQPGGGKSKVFSVHAPSDVHAKDRHVVLVLSEEKQKKFVASSSREAQEIVNAIRSSLVDGYVTAEDDEDDDDEGGGGGGDKHEDNDEAAAPPPPSATFESTPEPLPRSMWSDPGTDGFRIRSRTYLTDRVKQPAQAKSLFRLAAIDIFSTDKKVDYVTNHPSNRVRLARERGDRTFVYSINFQTPGPPYRSYVCYFVAADERVKRILAREPFTEGENEGASLFGAGFPDLLRKFFLGADDSFRDSHFKIIPRICEGPFLLKSLTPQNKPCLLAQKLKINYYRDEFGLEMDLDIGRGDILADNLTRIGCNHAKGVVVDVAFLLESKEQAQLPEFLVGVMRADHVDFSFMRRME